MFNLVVIFWKSLLIGFAIAAPVGPIGVLCIKNSLNRGAKLGLVTGLGAAVADSIYGVIAGAGLTALTNFFINHVSYIHILGGSFLIYLAYKEFKSKPANINSPVNSSNNKTMLETFFSSLILTLTNPITIISFLSLYAVITNDVLNLSSILAVMTGIFVGSMIWWIILTTLTCRSKKFLPENFLNKIKYFSAAILFGFGIYSFLKELF
ncbi:MAG: LysE family translocator [Sphingobacteriia bacterium]|nr:LysE family translocator [Sphingobacteriia bacterium]